MKKICIIIHVFIFSCLNGFCLDRSEIVPQFYKMLMSKDALSTDDELTFFGGQECADVKNKLLTKDLYRNSKTPIWDYLRLNKDMFLTKNISNIQQFRATYSEPFDSVRAWNNIKLKKKFASLFPRSWSTQ